MCLLAAQQATLQAQSGTGAVVTGLSQWASMQGTQGHFQNKMPRRPIEQLAPLLLTFDISRGTNEQYLAVWLVQEGGVLHTSRGHVMLTKSGMAHIST